MARFDADLWKTRAHQRFERAQAKGEFRALEQLGRDLRAVKDLGRVVAWCESRKYVVVFDRGFSGEIDPNTKRVRVNGRMRPERQLYTLLHECGHMLIGFPEKGQRYSKGYSNPGASRTFVHRVDVVDEELEAWHRGKKLGGRLGVEIDEDAFDRLRAACIKTQLKWSLRVDEFGTEENYSA